jgi:pyocin large subunit-like protein
MSFQAMAWAIRQQTPNTTSKLVLLVLSNYADSENSCYPSQEHIATISHCSRRSVVTHIKQLEKLGFITVIRTKDGMKKQNRYILRCENISHNTNIYSGENIAQRKPKEIFKKKGRNKNFLAM